MPPVKGKARCSSSILATRYPVRHRRCRGQSGGDGLIETAFTDFFVVDVESACAAFAHASAVVSGNKFDLRLANGKRLAGSDGVSVFVEPVVV
jgi:hypothetical protein